jgi:hypothetical protein
MAFSGVGCVCGVCNGEEKEGVRVSESPYGGGRRVCIIHGISEGCLQNA